MVLTNACWSCSCILGNLASTKGKMAAYHHWRRCQVLFCPLTTTELQPDWSIATIISNIIDLRKFFLKCNFSWLRKGCNTAAHVAAKCAIRFCRAFCFNMYSLPVVIADAWKANSHCFACWMIKLLFSQKTQSLRVVIKKQNLRVRRFTW